MRQHTKRTDHLILLALAGNRTDTTQEIVWCRSGFSGFDRLKQNHFAAGTFRGGMGRRGALRCQQSKCDKGRQRSFDEAAVGQGAEMHKKCQPEDIFRLTYLGVLLWKNSA